MSLTVEIQKEKQMNRNSRTPKEASDDFSRAFLEYPVIEKKKLLRTKAISEFSPEIKKMMEAVYRKFEQLSNLDTTAAEEALGCYFAALVDILEMADDQRSSLDTGVDYSPVVEELYLMYCERHRNVNQYYVPENHPVRVMNRQLDKAFRELLKAADIQMRENHTAPTRKKLTYEILEAVFDTKKVNREQISLYCRNQVYETSPDRKKREYVVPFRQKKGNTEISYYRIWEKLRSYLNCHDVLDNKVRVAVFGELTGDWAEEKELLDPGVTVEWFTIEHFPEMGEYYFQSTDDSQLYDLSNVEDVNDLVHKYNIILFLDINCLYRQWQSEKTVEERNESIHCRWYLDRSREQKSFKDKAAYYQLIYRHVGLWLNSLHEIKSSAFEFDVNIFRNLMTVSDENTDIYLYIRDGNKIASYNLEYSGVCNDEYYAGKSLMVYKLSQMNHERFIENYRKFLEKNEVYNEKHYVTIKLWKILKSIDNKYCNNTINSICESEGISRGNLIKALDRSYLVLEYDINADELLVDIECSTFLNEELNGTTKSYLNDLAKVVLDYAMEAQNLFCVRKYFKELLINSVITNAGSVEDLVFAYIWSRPWTKTSFRWGKSDFTPMVDQYMEGRHKLRNTIYVLIERLENLRMRRVSDMRGYFLDVFRKMACPEVDEACFIETLHRIAECCEEFCYTSSSLFLNSTLIDYEEERVYE